MRNRELLEKALGISRDAAVNLFCPHPRHCNSTPKQAARVVRYFSEKGRIRWDLAEKG